MTDVMLMSTSLNLELEMYEGECVLVCLRLHAFEWQAFGEGQLLFPEHSGTKHSDTFD